MSIQASYFEGASQSGPIHILPGQGKKEPFIQKTGWANYSQHEGPFERVSFCVMGTRVTGAGSSNLHIAVAFVEWYLISCKVITRKALLIASWLL